MECGEKGKGKRGTRKGERGEGGLSFNVMLGLIERPSWLKSNS